MRAETNPVLAHFVLEQGPIIYRCWISAVPRVGDEVRFQNDKFYKVTRVIFVYDEDNERVNIGLVAA